MVTVDHQQPVTREPDHKRARPSEPLSAARSGYIPTLDGWRALAVVAVIFFHGKTYRWGPLSTVPIAHFGRFGVDLFFGISGLLICTRLLEEERLRGRIHLAGFYIRRVLRIQPPSLLVLAVVSLLMVIHVLPAGWPGVLAALTFTRNYLPRHPAQAQAVFTGHFWSLAVEEHFYLLLPAFLVLCRRFRARILLAAAALDILWATVSVYNSRGFEWDLYSTDRCIYFLIFPAGLAVLLQRDSFRQRAVAMLQPWPVLAVSLAVLLVVHIGNPLTALVVAALILSTVLHPGSRIGRLLEAAPLRYLGKISFGLYLWQELFFTDHYLGPVLQPLGLLEQAPWNFIAAFALAAASYHLLEKPCMRLGHRLARPALPGRPELAVPAGVGHAAPGAGERPRGSYVTANGYLRTGGDLPQPGSIAAPETLAGMAMPPGTRPAAPPATQHRPSETQG